MQKVISYSFGDNFIEKLASLIEDNFFNKDKDLSRLAVVFGGKRPSLFLKKELARRIKSSFLPPRFFSVDKFLEYALAGKEPFSKISDLDACFLVYNLAKEYAPDILKGRSTFLKFLPWAREILSFIEQLDLEDVRADSLKSVQFEAAIGYEVPENINALLKEIVSLREAYHRALKERKAYSRGLVYLLTSKIIPQVDFAEFDRILFCNFFYLHRTEKIVIKTLLEKDKAVLVFQGSQERWPVLKELSRDLSSRIEPEESSRSGYNLTIHAGSDTHSQVCLVKEILKEIKTEDGAVVVLPDSANLIPLLCEISSAVDEFNVSMGYPVRRSSLYSLFELLFRAQATKKENAYYAKDYLRILSHPLIKNLKLTSQPSVTRVLVHKLEEIFSGLEESPLGGSLFVKLDDIENLKELPGLAMDTLKRMDVKTKYDELKGVIKRLHGLLFYPWEKIDNFYDFSVTLTEFVNCLLENGFLATYPLNLKIAEKIFLIKEELVHSAFNREQFEKDEIYEIFKNKLRGELISFSGSPLKGLQILGLLETRALNFKNVIVMDVNEAVLPRIQIYEPLIPRQVMLSLGLTRLEKEEEIQRYQFMRLIAGAGNVHLIYEESEERARSRFIEELIWDREKQSKRLDVVPVHRAGFTVKVLPKKAEADKNPEVIDFLKGMRYSSTSIDTYIKCPLRFYHKYVLGLKEKKDLVEDLEGAEIGKFIHKLLEDTFTSFLGSKPLIDKRFKSYFFRTLNEKFKDCFEGRMKSDSFLLKEILNFRLKRFLEKEGEEQTKKILSTEKTFQAGIKLSCGRFNFTARVDRIDELEDRSILIIDYKTGGGELIPKSIDKIEALKLSRESVKNMVQSFQLPLYFYLAGREYKSDRLNAALYNLRTLEKKKFLKQDELTYPEQRKKVTDVFMKPLGFVIGEILDPALSFAADNTDTRYCDHCPYFYLCR